MMPPALFILTLLFNVTITAWPTRIAHGVTESKFPSWAGLFHLEPGRYTFTFSKVRGAYHSQAIRAVFLKSAEEGEKAIDDLRGSADSLFQTTPVVSPGGKGLVVKPGAFLYELRMDLDKGKTEYAFIVSEGASYVLFLETRPESFGTSGSLFSTDEHKEVKPDRVRTWQEDIR